jgi:hypothetical protein
MEPVFTFTNVLEQTLKVGEHQWSLMHESDQKALLKRFIDACIKPAGEPVAKGTDTRGDATPTAQRKVFDNMRHSFQCGNIKSWSDLIDALYLACQHIVNIFREAVAAGVVSDVLDERHHNKRLDKSQFFETSNKRRKTSTNGHVTTVAAIAPSAPKAVNTSCPANQCFRCGRPQHAECILANHPDANRDPNVAWQLSPGGRRWHEKSQRENKPMPRCLPSTVTASGGTFTPPREMPKPARTPTQNGESDDQLSSNSELITASIVYNGREKSVPALIDTGALAGSYINTEVLRWLTSQGAPTGPCPNALVCSAFTNACSSCLGIMKRLHVTLRTQQHSLSVIMQVQIIDSPFPLIIGLPQIRKFDLTKELREFFTATNIPPAVNRAAYSLSTLFKKDYELSHVLAAMRSMTLTDTPSVRPRHFGLNTIQAAQNDLKTVYQKHELLDQLEDDNEIPEWREDITDFFPPSSTTLSDVPAMKVEADLPVIVGDSNFHDELRTLLFDFRGLFARSISASPASVPPMPIVITDESAWQVSANRGPPRPQTPVKQAALIEYLHKMLETGIIVPSQASYYSQVLLVPKPNKKWRFCVDYRNLNEVTRSMGWPIPNIERLLVRLGQKRAKYFAVLDLTSGYHQVLLDEKSRKYAAFITDYGVFEPVRLWMGLKTAGSYFQQQISGVLHNLLYHVCELYIDDIVIFGSTAAEFKENLRSVFQRLLQYNITLNPEKAKIGLTQLEYVGRVINELGVQMSDTKINKVLDFPLPQTGKQLKQFLGLVNYFRSHVRNFSLAAYPLQEMLHDYESVRYRRLHWTDHQIRCFHDMKDAIANCSMLYFYDETSPVFVATDASDYGIGAYLYQLVGDKEVPIGYFCQTLTKVQQRWKTIEKECYAFYSALRHWEHLLKDIKFTVLTDHQNLRYLNTNTPKVVRWKLAVQEYDFTLQHIPGPSNVVADSLSRLCQQEEESFENKSADGDSSPRPAHTPRVASCLPCQESVVPCGHCQAVAALHDFEIPHDKIELIEMFHNTTVGHFGIDLTVKKLRAHGHDWPFQRQHVAKFIGQCPLCQKLAPIKVALTAKPFTTAALEPHERLNIDTIGPLPVSHDGYEHILVVVDCFTRFVELYPVRTTEGKEAARNLAVHAGRYGTPAQIQSDGGTQFVNDTVQALCDLLGTQKITTVAYSKEENALVERSNKEVMRHLRAFIYDNKILEDWVESLPMVQRIINSTPHSSIGVAPAQLLFGNAVTLDRNLYNLPSEVQLKSAKSASSTMRKWIDRTLAAQERLIGIAQKLQAEKDAKHIADAPAGNFGELKVGSYVLVAYPDTGMGPKPPTKLHTGWRGPYLVINIQGSAFTLQNLITQQTMTVHASMVKAFEYDPNRTDPMHVAMADKQQFLVEQILGHFGDPKRKSTLFFKVKWVGSPTITREPWAYLRDNEVLHKYLSSKPKLRKLIPGKFDQPAEQDFAGASEMEIDEM